MSTTEQLLHRLVVSVEALTERLSLALPLPLQAPDWNAAVAWRYRKKGSGHGTLDPVRHLSALSLDDLKEIEQQKEKLVRNTAHFCAGQPANNVLLTGARGTGKSSLIKAVLNTFTDKGLRLIEIDKDDLIDLPEIVEVIAPRPEKFIVFLDDLSFEDGESGYKSLKSILDGSVAASTPNVLIYATSNRRHLLPEYMKDNLSNNGYADTGEVHPGEVIEEKISLSERFGLWLSFYPFSQDEYLVVVQQWLQNLGVPQALWDGACKESLVWSLERGSRSGRVAYQFSKNYASNHS